MKNYDLYLYPHLVLSYVTEQRKKCIIKTLDT